MTALLTEHDEGGGALLVSRGVGGVLAGVAPGIGHPQVGDPDGRVLQAVVQEHNPFFESQVGETLPVARVVNSDVVPLALRGFPDPGHLEDRGHENRD